MKFSGSGVEAATINLVDGLKEKPCTIQEEHKETTMSSTKQGKEQQKKNVKDPSQQGLPTTKDAANFLPFGRSIMETNTLLK